jgi:GNAT superfamily N-acetyltransferase
MATIDWFDGDRAELQELFELADDSAAAIAGYRDRGRVLVARDGDAIVGHLQLIDDELKSLAVREDRQGEGIGARLVERAAEVCRAEGIDTLLVSTAAAGTDPIRFYMRRGFRMLRVVRDDFTPENGYEPVDIDGVPLRDQVWLSLDV